MSLSPPCTGEAFRPKTSLKWWSLRISSAPQLYRTVLVISLCCCICSSEDFWHQVCTSISCPVFLPFFFFLSNCNRPTQNLKTHSTINEEQKRDGLKKFQNFGFVQLFSKNIQQLHCFQVERHLVASVLWYCNGPGCSHVRHLECQSWLSIHHRTEKIKKQPKKYTCLKTRVMMTAWGH